MTVTVSTVQRATLQFDSSSTVLDLIQALTENLGGEWDTATLSAEQGLLGRWRLVASMDNGEEGEPNRAERWFTEDGEHEAVADKPGYRTCSCEFTGTDAEVAEHLKMMDYRPGSGLH